LFPIKIKIKYLSYKKIKIINEIKNIYDEKKSKPKEPITAQITNGLSYSIYLNKIQELKNNRNKWFGFNINDNFAKLLFLCDIPIHLLDYNDDTILTRKQKKEILVGLINLCKKTNSRQVLYYLNIWADDKDKQRGFLEFKRTFDYWFNFKKKPP